jgi:hypothetical protein
MRHNKPGENAMIRKHRIATTITLGVVLTAVITTGVVEMAASATASSKGKKITIDASVNDKGKGTVLVIGGIGDHGTIQPVTKAGKPSQDGVYERLRLQNGSITLNESAVYNNTKPSSYGSATCTGQAIGSGAAPIVKGTGSYAHVTGTITDRITIAYQLRSHAGRCDVNTNKPNSYFATVIGSGKVSLG